MPARQRALDAFPRSVPWILWVSVMHVCYIFLRDILIFILGGTNGSLPEYVRAIATDTALSEDVVPLLMLGGIFLVMPIISGAFIALVHLLMVRSPKWVQITAGAFTVLVAGALFAEGTFEPGSLDGFDFVYDGAQAFPLIVAGIYLSIFLGADTVLGWSLKHAIHQLASLPPMIAKVLPVLMVSVLFIFVNADLWKLANGLSFPRTWAVLGLMGILAVFVVVTASLERTARLLGRNRGDDVASFSEKTTTSAPQPSKTESGTPPRTGSKKRKSTNTDPSKSCPGQPHHPHDRVDYSGKLLHAARLRVLHGVLIRSH